MSWAWSTNSSVWSTEVHKCRNKLGRKNRQKQANYTLVWSKTVIRWWIRFYPVFWPIIPRKLHFVNRIPYDLLFFGIGDKKFNNAEFATFMFLHDLVILRCLSQLCIAYFGSISVNQNIILLRPGQFTGRVCGWCPLTSPTSHKSDKYYEWRGVSGWLGVDGWTMGVSYIAS